MISTGARGLNDATAAEKNQCLCSKTNITLFKVTMITKNIHLIELLRLFIKVAQLVIKIKYNFPQWVLHYQ